MRWCFMQHLVYTMLSQTLRYPCPIFSAQAWLLRDTHADAGHDGQPAAPSRHATSGQHHAQPAAFGAEAAASWSLAITTRKSSPVRARRPMYEALLRLEAQSAAVVDRQLHGEDIALSADTCCCIWTEASLKVWL